MARKKKETTPFGIEQIANQVYTGLQEKDLGQGPTKKLYRSPYLYNDYRIEVRYVKNWRRREVLAFEYRSMRDVACAFVITELKYKNIRCAVSNIFRYVALSNIEDKSEEDA